MIVGPKSNSTHEATGVYSLLDDDDDGDDDDDDDDLISSINNLRCLLNSLPLLLLILTS